jgi:hypothetical protein
MLLKEPLQKATNRNDTTMAWKVYKYEEYTLQYMKYFVNEDRNTAYS